jgi:dTMP kinase
METGEKRDMKHFVTFEGVDGSGKSTIAALVAEKLRKDGYDVVQTFEPTDSALGKYVQESIKFQGDPFVTAFSFIADRIQHCNQIKAWLDAQKIVLCDRYAESTYAYQGAQLEGKIRTPIEWLQELSEGRILVPDRTFVFMIDPKSSLARIQSRNELIPFERLSFLEHVHANYQQIAKGDRFLLLDATKTKEEITDLCYLDIVTD